MAQMPSRDAFNRTGQFDYYRERQAANDLSRRTADRDSAAWTTDELELLDTWNHTEDELTEMAYVLGRTREACRVRYYLERRKNGVTNTEVKMPAPIAQPKWEDDEDWPSYYVRG